MTMRLAPISTRLKFAELLNERGLVGEAVEVGTHRAAFAVEFLRAWKGKTLWCVDPWDDSDKDYIARQLGAMNKGISREDDMAATIETLRSHIDSGLVKIDRCRSIKSAKTFADDCLDFVYIDANYWHVMPDLMAWWPKVKSGGLLAGHDFVSPGEKLGGWGQNVQPAVLRFAEAQGVDVWLVVEESNQPWSFYLEKP